MKMNIRRWLKFATERDIRCLFGHRRGDRIGISFSKRLKVMVVYKCPRCSATWTRRPRKDTRYDESAPPIFETIAEIAQQNTAAQVNGNAPAGVGPEAVPPAPAAPDADEAKMKAFFAEALAITEEAVTAQTDPLDHLGAVHGDKTIARKEYGPDPIFTGRDGVLRVRKQEE